MIELNDISYDKTVNTIGSDRSEKARLPANSKVLGGAFVSILLFMAIYCARPEDWIAGLMFVPLAKIAGILAFVSFVFSIKDLRWPLPKEVVYLILLVCQLFATVPTSAWPSGALKETIDFSKVVLIVIVMISVMNTPKRLRQIVFIQSVSVAVIAGVTIWKAQMILGRLKGVLQSYYSDPNDLALIIVITLPLALALLLLDTGLWKAFWASAMLVMTYVVLLTGSRGGFLTLVVTASVCVWEFGVRRRRYVFLLAFVLAGVGLLFSSSGLVGKRLKGTFDASENTAASYASAQAREEIFWRSIEVTLQHPFLGVGPGNFQIVSGSWHVTHNSFTSMSSEGGIPALIWYSLILWTGLQNVKAVKRLAKRQKQLSIFASALQASLTGYIVGSLFLSETYQFFPYFLVTYTTALLWMAKRSDKRPVKERFECSTESTNDSWQFVTQSQLVP